MEDRPDTFGFGAWSTTNAGTSAGVTATHTLKTNATQGMVTAVSGSSDAAALVTIESPASTIVWQQRFAAAFNFSTPLSTPIPGAASQSVLVKISASASHCEANLSGYDI